MRGRAPLPSGRGAPFFVYLGVFMDRCAVFVDAGYLFAAGGDLCYSTRSRQDLRLDAAAFNQLVRTTASNGCSLPVLRTYWYDGARSGVPTAAQKTIAGLPNVKLRLGRINASNQQKGVDALVYRDLMTLARERAISDAFLLSGDEDLREGVVAAQDMGVRVTVVGIAPRAGYNQSRDLLDEADEVLQFARSDLTGIITRTQPPAALLTDPASSGPPADLGQLGAAFAQSWLASANESDLEALKADRPRIPSTLDGEMLRYAEGQTGISLRGQEGPRRELRRGFWTAIEEGSD